VSTIRTNSSTKLAIPPQFQPQFNAINEAALSGSQRLQELGAFPGPFVAPSTPLQQEALGQTEQIARNQFGNIGQGVLNLGLQTANGAFLDPRTNPGFQGALQAAFRPALQAFREQVVPGIQNAAIQQGAFGGTREGIVESQAARNLTNTLFDTAGRLAFQNFSRERQLQQLAPTLINQGVNLQLQQPRALASVGDIQRQFEQQAIQDRLAAFNEQINAALRPLQPLERLFSVIPLALNGKNVAAFPGPGLASNIQSGLQAGLGAANATAAIIRAIQQGQNPSNAQQLISGLTFGFAGQSGSGNSELAALLPILAGVGGGAR